MGSLDELKNFVKRIVVFDECVYSFARYIVVYKHMLNYYGFDAGN